MGYWGARDWNRREMTPIVTLSFLAEAGVLALGGLHKVRQLAVVSQTFCGDH